MLSIVACHEVPKAHSKSPAAGLEACATQATSSEVGAQTFVAPPAANLNPVPRRARASDKSLEAVGPVMRTGTIESSGRRVVGASPFLYVECLEGRGATA